MSKPAHAFSIGTDELSRRNMIRLVDAIKNTATQNGSPIQVVSIVADILDQETASAIKEWLVRINADENLCSIELTDEARSSHLPQLFKELVHRLRHPLPLGTKAPLSKAAHKHGLTRRDQGYSAAMLVEESRLLQVSIFDTLHKNNNRIDFKILLLDVMVIADEVDLQLAQAMTSYVEAANADALPMAP
jgi:hypothetical protein